MEATVNGTNVTDPYNDHEETADYGFHALWRKWATNNTSYPLLTSDHVTMNWVIQSLGDHPDENVYLRQVGPVGVASS